MKNLSILLATGLFTLACQSSPDPVSAQSPAGYKSYGAAITADGAITTADLSRAMQGRDSMQVKLKAEIITTCQRKGCWMDVKMPEGGKMKVRFVDYGFFVPTAGQEGKTCVMEGQVTRETIPVSLLRHYAEDAGRSKEEIEKITEPEVTLNFLADGVLIKE